MFSFISESIVNARDESELSSANGFNLDASIFVFRVDR